MRKTVCLFLLTSTLATMTSCSPTSPTAPSVTTNYVTNALPDSLKPGQFYLQFSADDAGALSVSGSIYCFLLSNQTSPALVLNGVTSNLLPQPPNGSSAPTWRIYYFKTTGPTVAWRLSNSSGVNSGTVTMPTFASITIDGSPLATASLTNGHRVGLGFSFTGGHTASFVGQNLDFSVILTNYSYYNGGFTNVSSANLGLWFKRIGFLVQNGFIDALQFPNSYGGFGEGYVTTQNRIEFEPVWSYPYDGYAPVNTTNVAVTSLPSSSFNRTILTNETHWYRFNATVGQVFTARVVPVSDNGSLQMFQQKQFSFSTEGNSYTSSYNTNSLVYTFTNSGASAGSYICFGVTSWNSNAYQVSFTSP